MRKQQRSKMTKSNPLIEPKQGDGRCRWRQITRRGYVSQQSKLGKKALPAQRSNNNRVELKPIPFPRMYDGKQHFHFSPNRKKGFVQRFRCNVNPLLY